MKNKFELTQEENIFIAKRNIVDYIFKSAKLEGLAITFPQTQLIVDGMTAQGVSVADTIVVNNLKRCWEFILDTDTLSYPADLKLACHINRIIGGDGAVHRAGEIRKMDVRVATGDGNDYMPKIPNTEEVEADFNNIIAIVNPTERAITMMLYGMRSQLFYDGNKRTSMMVANQIMVANGAGILTIPETIREEFFIKLMEYYHSDDMSKIKQFVYDNAIDGIHLEKDRPAPTVKKEIEPER